MKILILIGVFVIFSFFFLDIITSENKPISELKQVDKSIFKVIKENKPTSELTQVENTNKIDILSNINKKEIEKTVLKEKKTDVKTSNKIDTLSKNIKQHVYRSFKSNYKYKANGLYNHLKKKTKEEFPIKLEKGVDKAWNIVFAYTDKTQKENYIKKLNYIMGIE